MPYHNFHHPIKDGIVHADDQTLLDQYVVSQGTRSTCVRVNGKKQGGLHDILLVDGNRAEGEILRRKQLRDHVTSNLIKVINSNGIVRYYAYPESISDRSV